MTPNLDFWKRHIDAKKWRFVVAFSLLVVVAYTYNLITSLMDNDSWSSAISGAVLALYVHSLGFQLIRPPGKNRYWVVLMADKFVDSGGPYTLNKAYDVFFKVGNILYEEPYTGIVDTFLIQSKDKETAIKEAHTMKRERKEDEA